MKSEIALELDFDEMTNSLDKLMLEAREKCPDNSQTSVEYLQSFVKKFLLFNNLCLVLLRIFFTICITF